MRFLRPASVLAVCLGLASCQTIPVVRAAPIRITLVGTNDVHGWVATQHETLPSGDLVFGGAAVLAGYLRILRAENPDGVVLIDGGDLFQGTLISNLTEGSAVIDAYNALGYSAAAIGNHEFDYGPVGPVSAAKPGLDPFGALKARIAEATFPLLTANVFEVATKARPRWLPVDGTTMVTRHGVNIGIIGLTTPSTPTTTLPINVASLEFRTLSATTIESAKALRARGADLVIAAVHEGGGCSDNSAPLDLSSCDTDTGEIFQMLREMPRGTLDAVVAGHTHAYIAHLVDGTAVIESGAQGRSFGLVELTVDPTTKHVTDHRFELHDLCGTVDAATAGCHAKSLLAHPGDVRLVPARFHGQSVVVDPAVEALLEPAARKVAELQHRDLGLTVPVTLGRNFEEESALGSFLADSMRAMSNADVGVLNSGGLRADLKRGPLLYGALYEVMPFDNTLATLEVTAEQLISIMRSAYSSKRGVVQVSGVEVELVRCPTSNRLRTLTVGGKPLEKNKTYRLVMPDYLARGGGGFAAVLETVDPRRIDLGETRSENLRDELVGWLQRTKSTIEAPRPGRIRFATDPAACAE